MMELHIQPLLLYQYFHLNLLPHHKLFLLLYHHYQLLTLQHILCLAEHIHDLKDQIAILLYYYLEIIFLYHKYLQLQ